MATLKDVQFSTQGEDTKKSSLDSDVFIPRAEVTTAPEQRFYIFKLVKKRNRLWLDGICNNVYNEKTKKRERTWLLSGADSIWQSELKDTLSDKNYVSKSRRGILFEEGIAMVKSEDALALEFLRTHNANTANDKKVGASKYDFYEYDAAREQESRMKKQMLKINMVIKAKEMPEEKMKRLASFFGISFNDDYGFPKSPDGIRTELMVCADNNPVLFEKYIDSREVEVSYNVKKAIVDAKIDLVGQTGNAIWAGGKGFIAKIPAGRKPHEYLTELAMTNSEEGKNFLEQLQSVIK